MTMQCGYFMSFKNNYNCYKELKINNVFDQSSKTAKRINSPFFSMFDEENTVSLFLEALSKSTAEDAKAYVSKEFVDSIDLKEIKDFFETTNYKNLMKVEFSQKPKNYKTNSILVIKEGSKNSIIHLHLVHEPDLFGKWKINGIDKE